MLHAFKAATRPALLALIGLRAGGARRRADRSWLDQKLLAAAKKEGALVVYGSMNEEEALPYYKIFERRDRHQGQLCAHLRHRRHRPHRGRIPRQAERAGTW